MKIIDLLNKIANGEEVPEKIKLKNFEEIYTLREDCTGYKWYGEEKTHKDFGETIHKNLEYILKQDIEILEEPKKIEKWGEGALEEMENCTDYTLEDLQKYIRILAETQNELIDEINNLKEND